MGNNLHKRFRAWTAAVILVTIIGGVVAVGVHGEDGVQLEGRPAPDFTLSALDGTGVKLSDLKGKVVVLDFWATWCVPCRKVMPIVEKVTGKLADQGVVLYAINLREPPAKVKHFREDQGINVTVLLDRDGTVSHAYQVTTIPRLVLIDHEGTVAIIHTQLPSDLEQELTDELKQMVRDIPASQ